MNKAYLLTFCLLFASFTGCVDNSEDNDNLISEIEKLTEENKELNERLNNNSSDNDKAYNNLSSDIANLIEENKELNERLNNNSSDNDKVYNIYKW